MGVEKDWEGDGWGDDHIRTQHQKLGRIVVLKRKKKMRWTGPGPVLDRSTYIKFLLFNITILTSF